VVKFLHENSHQFPFDVIKDRNDQLKPFLTFLVILETDFLSAKTGRITVFLHPRQLNF